MIEQSQSVYYLSYALLCAATGVAYIRFKSTEGTTITTKEFKVFQAGFIAGYSSIILCELIAAASFYHTFITLKLSLEQIAKLYIVTVVSSTVTSVLSEIVDVGSRKDKCILSAVLYSVSMFSIFFGGHYEMLSIGRIVYGVASSLHHTSFEAYAIHQHSSFGFPDDWLAQTFSFLTHAMALMAALSGIVGQSAAAASSLGCIELCCALFLLTAGYLALSWEKDNNSPRFMLSGFVQNITQSIQAVRSNKQLLLLMTISSLCEASITVFTFYWAPWITAIVSEEDQHIPYEILFSSFVVASMLGNYIFQLYSSSVGIEGAFQGILIITSVSYFLGAVFQTAHLAFVVSVVVQMCMGGYWPSIGHLRGRLIMPELRSTALTIPKVATLIITVVLLNTIHHSPLMMLTSCAILNGLAAYLHTVYTEVNRQSNNEDDYTDDDSGDDKDDL